MKIISRTAKKAEIIDNDTTRHIRKEADNVWRYRSPELKPNGQPKTIFEYTEMPD